MALLRHHLLGMGDRHHLADELPHLVAKLKADPAAWYAANNVTAPGWIAHTVRSDPPPASPPASAPARAIAPVGDDNPDVLRSRHEAQRQSEHAAWRWAHFVNRARAVGC